MSTFRINVETVWNSTSVRKFAAETEAAIRRIRESASRAVTPARGAALQTSLQTRQLEAERGLRGIAAQHPDAFGAKGIAPGLDVATRASFAKLAETYKVQLLEGAKLEAAILRSSATGQKAQAAQQAADIRRAAGLRPKSAEQAAFGLRDQAVAADARKAASTPEARTERATQTALIHKTAGRKADLLARGLAEIEGETKEQTDARKYAHDRAAAQRRSSRHAAAMADETTEVGRLYRQERHDKAVAAAAGRRIARAVNAQASLEERRLADAQLGPGTAYQRLQQRIAHRPGQPDRPATSFSTASQSFGAGALTTARFALSGALLYGAVSSVQQLVKDASELERLFNQIESQFEAVGESADFSGFRSDVIDISKETGQAATEVASVAFQLKGAFGQGAGGTARAISETSAAIKIARVTGLELNEVVDSLTATSKSFGVSIEDVGDETLHLQERFGVLAKESIKVLADLGPTAQAVGLDLREAGALAAVIQQVSGRSGTAIAEGLGRVLPAIQESGTKLVALFSSVPALAGQVPDLAKELNAGATGDVFIRVIGATEHLNEAQKNLAVTLLGGRREAQILNPVFENSAAVMRAVGDQTDRAGKTQEYFTKLQDTLAQRLDRLKALFADLGQAAFSAGLGDGLKTLLSLLTPVVELVGVGTKTFAEFNEATGGTAAQLLLVAAALRLVTGQAGLGLLLKVAPAIGGRIASVAGPLVPGVASRAVAQAAVAEAAATAAAAARAAGAGRAATKLAAQEAASAAVAQRIAATSTAARAASATGSLGGLGSAGALAFTPLGAGVAVATATALAASLVYKRAKDSNETEFKRFNEHLDKATDTEIAKIVEDRGSLLDELGEYVLPKIGLKTERGEGRKEQQQRRFGGISAQVDAALAAGLLNKERTSNLEGFAAAFSGDDRLTATPDDIIKRAAEGQADDIAELEGQLASIRKDPKKRAELEAALNRLKTEKEKTENAATQAGRETESAERLDTVKSNYEAGLASAAELVAAYDTRLAQINKELSFGDLGADPAAYPKLEKEGAGTTAARAKALSDMARQRYDLQLSNEALAGRGGPAARVSGLTSLLRDPALTDPKARLAAANDIVAAGRDLMSLKTSMVDSAEDQLAILREGFAIPEEARVALILEEIQQLDPEFARLLFTVSTGALDIADAVRRFATGMTTNAAETIAGLRARIAEELAAGPDTSMQGGKAPAGAREAELNALSARLDAYKPPAERGQAEEAELARAEKAAAKERLENARKRLALRRAQSEGDPVAQAAVDIEEAELLRSRAATEGERLDAALALVQARQAQAQADLQIADGIRNVEKARAQAANDVVSVAGLELAEANEHLAAASARGDRLGALAAQAQVVAGEASVLSAQLQVADAYRNVRKALAQAAGDVVAVAELELEEAHEHLRAANERGDLLAGLAAEAQIIAAQASLAQAQVQIGDAYRNVDIAMASAAGDTVRVAELELEQARAHLDSARARGDLLGQLEGQAQLVAAQAGVVGAQLQASQSQTDFMLQMEQITTSQAITQLEALLKIPGITQEQTQQLLLKIKSLRDSVSSDLQFNIPSQIKLPTLYEVRRLRQGADAGNGSYQDNRRVQVQYNVFTPQDNQKALDDLVSVSSGQPRVGVQPRAY